MSTEVELSQHLAQDHRIAICDAVEEPASPPPNFSPPPNVSPLPDSPPPKIYCYPPRPQLPPHRLQQDIFGVVYYAGFQEGYQKRDEELRAHLLVQSMQKVSIGTQTESTVPEPSRDVAEDRPETTWTHTLIQEPYGDPETIWTTPENQLTECCQICKKDVRRTYMKKHMLRHSESPRFKCDHNQCPSEFYTNSALARHKVKHSGEKPFSCTLCQQSFTQRSSLKTHITSTHVKPDTELPAKCPCCDMFLSTLIALQQHIVDLHHPALGRSPR
ncbi:conserved hypothetical protein [Culex quinquefasciatus]|uniref:C2H2-type domain-containing protein n=1 Tax=Culex quinquefasciatus TaxID=7176 RepID=B0WD54_CULQU|nr:conserved hypothetical protein [Culex quinquefasciatus]|eukprot:XP_001846638.1 conserved hypothetical protein [Culex quinquefasciatus]